MGLGLIHRVFVQAGGINVKGFNWADRFFYGSDDHDSMLEQFIKNTRKTNSHCSE